jgi:hypothetical protein
MGILRVFAVKTLNFKSARSLLYNFLVRAARALLRKLRLKLGGVGINNIEDRRTFSDLSQYVLQGGLGPSKTNFV